MKKLLAMLTTTAFALTTLVACGGETPSTDAAEDALKIGMMTDAGTIDDKSFNQGTWEGLVRASKELGIKEQYVRPGGESTQDYITANDNLVMAGNQMIIAPGFKFEEAIGTLQKDNPDVKYVMLDAEPLVGKDADGNPIYDVADNTVSIFFAEEQAGFIAGVAAALQTQTGKVGFIGGMTIPPVARFGAGYVAGVAYANATYNTTVEVAEFLYEGTFTTPANGQIIAGGMYDKGIDIIFVSAGGTGNGVIDEAKKRGEAGEEVFVIGVDDDQYDQGIMSNGKSIILTSAMKNVSEVAFQTIEDFQNGEFAGGQTLIFNAENDSVGIPAENPNFTEDTTAKTSETFELLKDGSIVVPRDSQTLTAYLTEVGFENVEIVKSVFSE